MKAETTVEFSQEDVRAALGHSAFEAIGAVAPGEDFEIIFLVGGKEIAKDKPLEVVVRIPRKPS